MFIPEYTITPNTLNKITSIEYDRALIENLSILDSYKTRLEKEATASYIIGSLTHLGELPNPEVINKYVDGLTTLHSPVILNFTSALEQVENLALTDVLEEKDIKFFHAVLSKGVLPVNKQGLYRNTRIESKVEPEVILAEVSDLVDWYQGIDAKDTNPVIVAGIIKGQLETIFPFDSYNFLIANLITRVVMQSRGYNMDKYMTLETLYNSAKRDYEDSLISIANEDGDFTYWLEYFAGAVASQVSAVAEKVKLFAKDTKLAKVNGRIGLTERQNKIIEYLQDYGMLNNQLFERLFPDISEDSVLRDLKHLLDLGIVVKRGKTKSSRYELR